jgi:DNA polymerase-3 subunit epsilon
MLIAGADTETTGLEKGDHRLIEVYVGLYDLASRKKVEAYYQRIHPQRSILPGAQAVHGISIADLERCPTFEAVALPFRNFLESADLVVGHNWNGFDAPFIDAELERVKLPKLTVPTFDTMLEGRWASPVGAVPNLGALCWACEVEYDTEKAHAADYDVDCTMQCFFKGLDWGWYKLPAAVAARHAA